MAQSSSVLKWETLLCDAEWNREESLEELLPAEAASETENRPSRSPLRHMVVAFALSAMLACAVVLWLAAWHGVAAIEEELGNVVEVETWLQRSDHITATGGPVGMEADAAWRDAYLREMELASESARRDLLHETLIERTRLRSDLSMVQVTVTGEDGGVYCETRFYRNGPNGWQRTSPAPAFWGSEQVQKTEHFRIRYRQADGQAVVAASTKLDGIYMTLRNDLGLTGDDRTLLIVVTPESVSELGFLRFVNGYLNVPSPLLLPEPADMPIDALLVEAITEPLIIHLWGEARRFTAQTTEWELVEPSWSHVVRGVQIWQGQASSESAAAWFAETAEWLYGEAPAIRAGLRDPSPTDLETLCRRDSLWRLNVPIQVSLGSLCLSPDWHLRLRYIPAPPDRLDDVLDDGFIDEPMVFSSDQIPQWMRSVAAATVVDYYVDAYGREALPRLVDGFRMHDSWETLIPEVTGVSAAEFEAGWRDFLAERYSYDAGVE